MIEERIGEHNKRTSRIGKTHRILSDDKATYQNHTQPLQRIKHYKRDLVEDGTGLHRHDNFIVTAGAVQQNVQTKIPPAVVIIAAHGKGNAHTKCHVTGERRVA